MKRSRCIITTMFLLLGLTLMQPGQIQAADSVTVSAETLQGKILYEDTYAEGTVCLPGEEGLSASTSAGAGFQRLGDTLTGMAAQVYRACSQLDPGESVTIRTYVAGSGEVIGVWQDFLRAGYKQGLMAYKYDHPEKTDWTGSRIYASCSYDSVHRELALNCRYEYSSSYTSAGHSRLIRRAQEVAALCRREDCREQITALNEWLVEHCVYDTTAAGMAGDDGSRGYWTAHSPAGCLLEGRGVCESYAKSFQMVCNLLDIPCIIVGGTNHVWNYVGMDDGRWYLVDPTWNDTCGVTDRYLLTASDTDHSCDGLFDYPAAASTAYGAEVRMSGVPDDRETKAGTDSSADTVEEPPVLIRCSNTSQGVKLVWEVQNGRNRCQVFRRRNGSDWKLLAETEASEYVDATAASGKEYTYTVRSLDEEGDPGSYDPRGLTILALDPILASDLKTVNTYGGMKITWKEVAGAESYRIYRRTVSGSYRRIGSVAASDERIWVDPDAVNGTRYYYAVRACAGENLGGYCGRTHLRLASVKLTGVTAEKSRSLQVCWKANTRAGGYQVRISKSASFTSYKTYTIEDGGMTGTVLEGLTAGRRYYVKIRGYRVVNGVKYYSGWSSAKSAATL